MLIQQLSPFRFAKEMRRIREVATRFSMRPRLKLTSSPYTFARRRWFGKLGFGSKLALGFVAAYDPNYDFEGKERDEKFNKAWAYLCESDKKEKIGCDFNSIRSALKEHSPLLDEPTIQYITELWISRARIKSPSAKIPGLLEKYLENKYGSGWKMSAINWFTGTIREDALNYKEVCEFLAIHEPSMNGPDRYLVANYWRSILPFHTSPTRLPPYGDDSMLRDHPVYRNYFGPLFCSDWIETGVFAIAKYRRAIRHEYAILTKNCMRIKRIRNQYALSHLMDDFATPVVDDVLSAWDCQVAGDCHGEIKKICDEAMLMGYRKDRVICIEMGWD